MMFSVHDLESVLLFVVTETVLDDFKDSSGISFQMLLEKLLIPFFQMRTRIVEKNQFFKIGEVTFFVPATTPHEFGKVTANTTVRLTKSVCANQSLECIYLTPLKRVTSHSQLLTQSVQTYIQNRNDFYTHKNFTFETTDGNEFFIRYARPFFGLVVPETEIKVDTDLPKNIRNVRIAPIWSK